MTRTLTLIFICLIFLTDNSLAHVKHYNKIKYLKYNLFLNNELIGYHTFDFVKKKDEILEVNGSGTFKVSKFGIDLIKYTTNSHAIYQKNQLVKFNSRTTQNDKKKHVKIDLKENVLNIDGSSFKGETEKDSIVSNWWNHEIVKKNKQISSISGRITKQKVRFLGKKKITIDNKIFEAFNFHIFSDDNKPMKEKKINIKIWYDVETLIWLKASYEKLGKWEYRIETVEY